MNKGIIAIIAFVVGAALSYVYFQGQMGDASSQLSAVNAQLAEANEKAQSSASQVETLTSELAEAKAASADMMSVSDELAGAKDQVMTMTEELAGKGKMIEDLQSMISELKAATQ